MITLGVASLQLSAKYPQFPAIFVGLNWDPHMAYRSEHRGRSSNKARFVIPQEWPYTVIGGGTLYSGPRACTSIALLLR